MASVVVSCEHGGNTVPRRYAHLFAAAGRTLESHRGWDPGALDLARRLARRLAAPLHASRITRLLVELNRSPQNSHVFSEFSRPLGPEERARVLERYYFPYRWSVEDRIADLIRGGQRVVHVSVHSFTPRFRGVIRRADVGLLYDPSRPLELELCTAMQRAVRQEDPRLIVRRNYPYRGDTDGLTTFLRARFPPRRYLGIELEVSQKYMRGRSARSIAVRRAVVGALCEVLDGGSADGRLGGSGEGVGSEE